MTITSCFTWYLFYVFLSNGKLHLHCSLNIYAAARGNQLFPSLTSAVGSAKVIWSRVSWYFCAVSQEKKTTGLVHQRALNDLSMTRLSCRRHKIWLLPPFSSPATHRKTENERQLPEMREGRGWGKEPNHTTARKTAQIIYNSFNTFCSKLLAMRRHLLLSAQPIFMHNSRLMYCKLRLIT